jgi:hypothetical protein
MHYLFTEIGIVLTELGRGQRYVIYANNTTDNRNKNVAINYYVLCPMLSSLLKCIMPARLGDSCL